MNQNIDIEKLNYRNGVNGIVVDKDNNFLLVQKLSYGDNQWDFPGGGLEEGEDGKGALLRELQEELGTNKFEIIKKSKYVNKFEWPLEVIKRTFAKKGKTYRGQQKVQFLVKFIGSKDEIKKQDEELKQIKWVKYKDLKKHLIFENQWQNAERVIKELIEKV